MSTGIEIILPALSQIGRHSIINSAQPEDIENGLNALNSLMQMWLSLGIDVGQTPLSTAGDELGESNDARNGVISNLAMTIPAYYSSGGTVIPPGLPGIAASEFDNIQRLYKKLCIPNRIPSGFLLRGAGSRSLGTLNGDVFFGPHQPIANSGSNDDRGECE